MTDIYVPQRVGEGYFTDWQPPVAGNDLVAWAWDNAAGKYIPQVAPKITSFVNAAHTHQAAAGGGQLDHGLALTGLGDDDHTGYLLITGRAGGQTAYGGNAANEDLILEGTSHATKTTSYILLQPSGGLVGIGGTPDNPLAVVGNIRTTTALITPAVRPNANSTTALQLQNAAGTAILTVDTTNSRIGIGVTPGARKLHVYSPANGAVLITTDNGADPATLNAGVPLAVVFTGSANSNVQVIATAAAYAHTMFLFEAYRTSSSAFNFAKFTADADGTPEDVFLLRGDGRLGLGSGMNAPTAVLHLAASTTTRAQLRFHPTSGAAPTSPVDGDAWYVASGRLTFRRGSTTEIIPTAPTQAAFTQTFSTASRTMNAYTADNESAAYTGIDNAQAGTVYAQLTDLNALRVAVENLRATVENRQEVLSAVIDDGQLFGIAG